jgi:hypothetical protein
MHRNVTTKDHGMRPARAHHKGRRERDDGSPKAFRARRAAAVTSHRTQRAANRAGVEV